MRRIIAVQLLPLVLGILIVNGNLSDDLGDCPPGLPRTQHVKSYNDVCLFLITGKLSWNDANSNCHIHGGHLLYIKDQDKQDFIYNTLQSMNWGDWGVWIGTTDHDSEGVWKWTDGSNLTYGNWHPGEGPTHRGFLFTKAGYEDCALLRLNDNGRWHYYECGTALYHHTSICEYQKVYRPTIVPTTTSTATASTTQPTTTLSTTTQPTTTTTDCSAFQPLASLVKFDGSNCLGFVKEAKTWNDADDECVRQGGRLLQIHDQMEQAFVFESLRSLHWSDSGAWIGATDRGSEGRWTWTDDSPVKYDHWKPGEGPSHNATNENCAMINVDDGMWYDYDCGSVIYNQAYICQYSQ